MESQNKSGVDLYQASLLMKFKKDAFFKEAIIKTELMFFLISFN